MKGMLWSAVFATATVVVVVGGGIGLRYLVDWRFGVVSEWVHVPVALGWGGAWGLVLGFWFKARYRRMERSERREYAVMEKQRTESLETIRRRGEKKDG